MIFSSHLRFGDFFFVLVALWWFRFGRGTFLVVSRLFRSNKGNAFFPIGLFLKDFVQFF